MAGAVMIIMFILALAVGAGVGFLLYWPRYGAPFVPTGNNEVEKILWKLKLKPGQIFCDVGCGDGRLVTAAVKNFGATGIGTEINPLLVIADRIQSKMTGVKAQFLWLDFNKKPLPKADVYYLYLWPGTVEKIAGKFEEQKLTGITVLTKGFEINRWKNKLVENFNIGEGRFWMYKISG